MSLSQQTKICRICGSDKNTNEFYERVDRGKVTLRSECISCCGLIRESYREKNIDRVKARQAAHYQENKTRICATQRDKRRADPLHFKDLDLKKAFKISMIKYEELLLKQNYVCAGCGKPETRTHRRTKKPQNLSVDHDHSCCPGNRSCGVCIRGLLCHKCNWILGIVGDSLGTLSGIIAYLKKYNDKSS